MNQRLRRFIYFTFLIPAFLVQPLWAFSTGLNGQPLNTESWWAEAVADDAGTGTIPKMEKKTKDPGLAMSLATLPGIAIHGSGHMYAGRPVTSIFLLLAEAGGIYMAYRGSSDVYNIVSENLENDKSTAEVIESLSDTSQISHGIGLAVGGLMLFLSSWLYDATGSPIVVEEYNAKIKQTESPKVNAKLTLRGFEVEFDQLF